MRIVLIVLFLCPLFTRAQFHKTPDGFVTHLLNKRMYDEAIIVLVEKLEHATDTLSKDSLSLLIGKTYYYLQQLPASIRYLDVVSPENPSLHSEAVLFSAFNESYLKRTDLAISKLIGIKPKNDNIIQLKDFELAGNYLLRNDFAKFDSIQNSLGGEWHITQQQQKNFLNYRKELEKLKSRSPFLAGTLSALVPGAGKFYAGKRGNAIYTFLISGLLAAQAYEAYRKDGVESARFIIYGSLFTSFYIGNIWGSALAVRISTNEKKDAITSQILFDMHIPLRTFFK